MDYDRGLTVNTLNAHRLLALADREPGADTQQALMRRLFDAHFAEGQDVGDPRVLAAIAGEVGMDADAARNYLETDDGTGEVHEEIANAQRLGVNAVPTYVFDDKYIVEGAQPAELFLDARDVSRRHARITISADEATIEDLESKNGTFVTDRRLDEATRLVDGDSIRIGSVLLTFTAIRSPGSTQTEHDIDREPRT